MYWRRKDWRRLGNRDDRCPEVFLAVGALAATVMFWRCHENESWPQAGQRCEKDRKTVRGAVLPMIGSTAPGASGSACPHATSTVRW